MRRATIIVTRGEKSFTTSFDINDDVKEYQVADEAYRVAMMYAETQVLAEPAAKSKFDALVEMLNEIDYGYTIEEVE